MTQHDDVARLRHMFEHAREATEMLRGKSRHDLDANRMLNLALVRLLEVVGEAAGRVNKPTQDALSRIPWSEVIGLRHRLIHGYDSVDLDILWEIVTRDLPHLTAELEQFLSATPRDH
jgi:uncharacterized protein with HEPN domain